VLRASPSPPVFLVHITEEASVSLPVDLRHGPGYGAGSVIGPVVTTGPGDCKTHSSLSEQLSLDDVMADVSKVT
jgi:hypothetical protein